MQPDYNLLKQQISELMAWKAERERQQLSFPLDKASYDIIGTNNDPIGVGGVYVSILGDNPGASLGYGVWTAVGNNALAIGINSGTGGGGGTLNATAGGTPIANTINFYFWLRTS